MKQDLILITGMSGSGKSVALRALEDAGFYCVDNLPPQLLPALIDLMDTRQTRKVAVAIDVRSADALPQLPRLMADLAAHRVRVKALFLDATTDTLVRRFSETRRRHPLNASEDPAQNSPHRALVEAIELERQMLMDLREHAHVIDTSLIRGQQLQVYVKALFESAGNALTLVFESFGFKKGLPLDADYVFDVRMLPNPYYQSHLKALTGRDPQVAQFLSQDPSVMAMRDQVQAFLTHWLPSLDQDQRSYVTVAIGCTGGQHRSVFLVEQLAAHFAAVVAEQKRPWAVLKRHRELDAAPTNA